jgi:hypothetical protein
MKNYIYLINSIVASYCLIKFCSGANIKNSSVQMSKNSKCLHGGIKNLCVMCAELGIGGKWICQKEGHGFKRISVCICWRWMALEAKVYARNMAVNVNHVVKDVPKTEQF